MQKSFIEMQKLDNKYLYRNTKKLYRDAKIR